MDQHEQDRIEGNPAPLSDEQLQAALAEAAAISAQLASQDQERQQHSEAEPVVPIPVPPPFVPPLSPQQETASGQTAPPVEVPKPPPPDQQAAASAQPDQQEKPHGLLGRWLRRPSRPAGATKTVSQFAARPNIILRLLDLALDLVNRPFAFLGPGARRAIGYVSVVTVVISLGAGFLLPRLVPRKDVVSFVAAKRAQLATASADKVPASGH